MYIFTECQVIYIFLEMNLQTKQQKKGARNTERAVINASKTQTSLSFIKKDIDKIAQEE